MKKIFLIPLIIAGITVLSGCEKDGKELDIPQENVPTNAVVTEYIMQDGDTQVVGEVTQIVGNEVTLALGEAVENSTETVLPKMPPDGEKPQFDKKNGDAPKRPFDREKPPFDMENGEVPQIPQGEDMPQMPDGGFPNMDGKDFPDINSGEAPEFKRGGRKSSISVEKSGETGTYIIPVGMIVSGASGRNNDYSAISTGMTLRLTLNSDGYTVFAEIL